MELLTTQYINQLLEEQKQYFRTNVTLSKNFRINALNKLKQAILEFQKDIENALYLDLGKNSLESYVSEVGFVLNEITETKKHLGKWMKAEKVKSPMSVFPAKSLVTKQPLGTVLIISPFNYPFQLLIDPLVASISAGNCTILSPSELAPNTANVIKQMITKTFDRNFIACVDGGIENNTLLLQSRVDKIFFTGSINVGKIVMQTASKNLTPVTLELGGKSPVIVTDDTKLDIACQRIVWGKFMNAGQTCVAPDYILADNKIFDKLVQNLKQTITQMYGSDIYNNKDFGRIINTRHFDRLANILEQDKSAIVFGGETDRENKYISPTLLCPENIETACSMQEEIFGPILPIFKYDTLDEAINFINGKEKPLALYIFSQNNSTIEKIINSTNSGGVSVNDTISHIVNTNLPFGGVGHSGMGNYHGKYGFLNFSHTRSVLRRSTNINMKLAFPPYTDKKAKLIKKFIK